MKKFLLPILIIFAPAIALADSSSTLSLPPDFVSQIWGNVTMVLTALAPYVETILGVVLAAVLIEVVIGAIKK